MIVLVRRVIRKSDDENTVISEFFKFFKDEERLDKFKKSMIDKGFCEENDKLVLSDGDKTEEIAVIEKFSSEKEGLKYLAKINKLDNPPFESLPDLFWIN